MNSLLIRPRIYGFFSTLFQVIDNLKYCEINNLKPIIYYDSTFLYNDGNENVWEEFFEKINDGIAEGNLIDVYSLKNHPDHDLHFIDDFIISRPNLNDNSSNFSQSKHKLWELVRYGQSDELELYRYKINYYIKKYIKPSKDIVDCVDRIKFNYENTLSVHVRGTDYVNNIGYLEKIINKIEENIKKYNYQQIFVSSDNFESIKIIYEKFKSVIFYDTNLRCEKFNSGSPICHLV